MSKEMTNVFYEMIEKYLGELDYIDTSFFDHGRVIDKAIHAKSDKYTIFLLINEYTILNNVIGLITFFKLMTSDFIKVDSNTAKGFKAEYYSRKIKQLIKFHRRIKILNNLDVELINSNPSNSGMNKILNDFAKEFSNEFIINKEYSGTDHYDYIVDIINSLCELLYMMRILLINSTFIGSKQNRFYVISKQILEWLTKEVMELKYNVK